MSLRYFILKALCLSVCLALSSEESARDFMEHILRMPDPDKALNSVLGRLERNRQRDLSIQRLSDDSDYIDLNENSPEYAEYMEDTRRGLRESTKPRYFPICNLSRKTTNLNTKDYEYKPAHYEEVLCSKTVTSESSDKKDVCTSLGFSCVQINKTLNLTRRKYSSDCWETITMIIPTGCECMWPAHILGDINNHS